MATTLTTSELRTHSNVWAWNGADWSLLNMGIPSTDAHEIESRLATLLGTPILALPCASIPPYATL